MSERGLTEQPSPDANFSTVRWLTSLTTLWEQSCRPERFKGFMMICAEDTGCESYCGFDGFLFMLSACAHNWDRTDTKLACLSVAASAFDAYTTKHGDFNEYYNPFMHDGNVCLVIGVTEAVVIGLSLILPKKLRRALLIGNIAGRTGFALHNLAQDR